MASLLIIHSFLLSLFWVVIGALHTGDASLQIRSSPGTTDADTMAMLGRALHVAAARSDKNVHKMNETKIEKSWSSATLFEYNQNAIGVKCSTCYLKGTVNGDLTIAGDFNLTDTIDGFKDEVTNITSEAVDKLEDYAQNVWTDITTKSKIEAFPTLDLDFNIEDLPALPEAQVHIQFDDLELYLDLDIILATGATYSLNLFTSETAAGISVPGVVTAGVVFSVDLILIATAEVDIGSGIHIKFDDPLTFDMELFSSNLSSIDLPSGSYEFLPVTIEGEGTIQAILSLKTSVGFELASNKLEVLPDYSAGVSADIFAYVADFLLGVEGSPTADEGGCELGARAEYTLAVGAAAGATVAVDMYSWGPAPETTVPVWYTTLTSTCAKTKSATSSSEAQVTARAEMQNRDDLITTSVTSKESYTIVRCMSSGLVNCPANLQNTTSTERTLTSTVTVESGVDPTFPAQTFASVTSTIPFGTNVKKISSRTGEPTSYTPTATSGGKSILNGTTNGTNNKLIIGLCVGLGVPLLILLAIGAFCCIRRRNNKAHPQAVEQRKPFLSSSAMNTPVQVQHEFPRKPVS